MTICPKCGAQTEGQFCARCGSPVTQPGPQAPQYPPQSYPQQNYPPQGYPSQPTPQPPPSQAYGAPQQGYAPPSNAGYPPAGGYNQQNYQQPGYQQPGAYGQQPYGAPGGYTPAASQGGLSENVAALLAYIFPVSIIFLVLDPYKTNRFIRFHCFQALFLFGVGIVFNLLTRMLISISGYSLAILGLVGLVSMVFGLAMLAAVIYCMVKAYQHQKFLLPVIGPLAEKQA